jgi:hypothetical protein
VATVISYDTSERCRIRHRVVVVSCPALYHPVEPQPAIRKPRWTKPKPPMFRRKPPPKRLGLPIGRFARHRVPFA